MGHLDFIRKIISKIKGFAGKKSSELQPRDILGQLIAELERKKKLGIEENAFVPNEYALYLSPVDYEEISPLITGLKEQLKNKIMERVKKKGYKILSSSFTIEMREDSGLQKNQVVIESFFSREKTQLVRTIEEGDVFRENKPDAEIREFRFPTDSTPNKEHTRIIEDKKTKIIDNTKLELEILEGGNAGEVIKLKEGEYIFGRGKDATILIRDNDETVSRTHFKIVAREGKVYISDLNSANGTRINDIAIEDAELKTGDMISAGKVLLRVA